MSSAHPSAGASAAASGAGPGIPSSPPPPPPRGRGSGTAADMIRSLAVCGGFVAVVVLIFFHGSAGATPPVDVAGATAAARSAGLDVRAPRLPKDWTPSSARYAPDTTEGLPTWHVGYLAPSGSDAEVDVTKGATPAWIDGVLGDDSGISDDAPPRSRVIDGERWQVRSAPVDGSTVRGLVRVDGQTTIIVSGHASAAALAVLAHAVS